MTDPEGAWAPANDFHSKDPLATDEERTRRLMSEIGCELLFNAIEHYKARHHPELGQ